MIHKITKNFNRSIIMIACISIFGCSDQDKISPGLCYDYRSLMFYPNLDDKSLYLVVGDFLRKPSKFEVSDERLSVEGYSKDNILGKVLVNRRHGMIKIVSYRRQHTIERELSAIDFWRINQLVKEQAKFSDPASLQDSLVEVFSEVLGEEFANRFGKLLEAEHSKSQTF